MKIPGFFVLFIIFILVLRHNMKKTQKQSEKRLESYYEREQKANSVRKKSLDSVVLYSIDLEKLPFGKKASPELVHIEEEIKRLSTLPMASFKGCDNTQLKLDYGTANLSTLIQYETTYNLMLDKLTEYSKTLLEMDANEEAMMVLEVAVDLESDKSHTYIELSNLYHRYNPNALSALKELAEDRHIHRKDQVLTHIKMNATWH